MKYSNTFFTITSTCVLGVLYVVHCLPNCLADVFDSSFNNSLEIGNETLLTSQNESSFDNDLIETTHNSTCGNRPWLMGNECKCADSLDGIVYCDTSKNVFVKSQFCVSVYHGEEVIGRCPYTYLMFNDPNTDNIDLYYKLPNQTQDLEYSLCDRLNRRGLFCGKCKENFSYPMYPRFIECVECPTKDHIRNVVLYIVVSYVPLTIFLMLVVCLRINAASAPLNAFIFISQVMTQPPFTRGFIDTINNSPFSRGTKRFMSFLFSLYGIWNLDFFVALIPPFCLPNLSVFSVIAQTYIIALYPLVVLILLYLSIEIYSRDFRILVWLWKPFNWIYVKFKMHWNVRASIVDAFATFFLLSYVKILFISMDLFSPSHIMSKNGSALKLVSYFDGSFTVSPKPITILVVLSIFLLLILFTLLPAVLLLLYPCGFCQKCLNKTKLNFQSLHFLMYSFNVCYKDGMDGSQDYWSFAAVFLIARQIISVLYAVAYFDYYTSVIITITVLIVIISALQPYNERNSYFNRQDPLMIFFLVVWLAAYRDIRFSAGNHLSLQRLSVATCFISLMLPLFLMAFHFVRNSKFIKKWRRNRSSSSLEDSLEQRTHSSRLQGSNYVNAVFALEDK